jgi:hypothetical protein
VPRPTQPKRDVEDVEEDEDDEDEVGASDDSEVVEDSWQDPVAPRTQRELTIDSIDVESEATAVSPPEGGQMEALSAEGNTNKHRFEPIELDPVYEAPSSQLSPVAGQREAKRRRLSPSPVPEFEGSGQDGDEMYLYGGPADSDGNYHSDEEGEEKEEEDDDDPLPSLRGYGGRHGAAGMSTQPTFRAPPRFKPLEQEAASDGLPTPFSPQRRGAKYLVGGLAAELQGLLSEVKGWDGEDGATASASASTIRLRVQSVCPGKRMSLAYGRIEPTGEPKSIVLAGRGNVEGLGRRADVAIGQVVRIGAPLWDAEVDGSTWTVACNWSIEE